MIINAANAGKQGFLTSINASKNTAINTYTSIKNKAKALAIEIAKEKAMSNAKAKARELTYNRNKLSSNLVPAIQAKSLTNVIQLKTKIVKG